ncbi:aspartic peptidase domain-containing protein [Xylariaceae sp. FL0016]|nr:aspartic peptidase domain-containing protein [Xylariaceae sp. FL0016]
MILAALLAYLLPALEAAAAGSWTVPLHAGLPLNASSNGTSWAIPNPNQPFGGASGLNVPLADWIDRTDNQWYSTISVGTPPQNFSILWDTGSSDLLIPRDNCTNCGKHALFNPANSSSFSNIPNGAVAIPFVSGGDSVPRSQGETARGRVVYDNVTIGPLGYSDQAFVLCEQYTAALSQLQVDGIIGLAPMNVTHVNETSLFWNLWTASQLKFPFYSLYLPSGQLHGGQITLGGTDTSKYVGDITWIDLDPNQYKFYRTWALNHAGLYTNGASISRFTNGQLMPPTASLLRTGSAFIQTPDYGTAEAIYAALSPNITQIDPAGA